MNIIRHAAFIPFLLLLATSLISGYACFYFANPEANLFPKNDHQFPWVLVPENDLNVGGASTVKVIDDQHTLDFQYQLSHKSNLAHAGVSLNFQLDDKHSSVDLSKYSSVTFTIKCMPKNTLFFGIQSFDSRVTVKENGLSKRIAETLLKCEDGWTKVKVDLNRLKVPGWWLQMFKLDLAEDDYSLQKVLSILLYSSSESPFDQESRVQISSITLHGKHVQIIYLYFIALIVSWFLFLLWYFKVTAKEIEVRASNTQKLVGYQQLTLESFRDKEKSGVLLYMSTHYADPEIEIDQMSKELGISRSKINDILKAEVGNTFTAYLNKLRITEAARLLTEMPDANITEIVYKVGYKNISYFNKLFKDEFSCTPKHYKQNGRVSPSQGE